MSFWLEDIFNEKPKLYIDIS